MDARTILENVRAVSARFATERSERQQRRALDAADFAQLREAGFPLTGVPVDQGGIWQSVRQSTRPLRTPPHAGAWGFVRRAGLCHVSDRARLLAG